MRIVRYLQDGGHAWGIIEGDGVLATRGAPFQNLEPVGEAGRLDELELAAPVSPSTVMCVGRNYRAHADELDNDLPTAPLLFLKPPAAIVGPGAPVVLPHVTTHVDHEAELAVVISRDASRLDPAEAHEVIGGYTCANDVTARDLQRGDPGGQWTRAKGFDTFCPMGPWVETDLDAADVRVTAHVNGDLRQDGRTSELVFSIAELIAYVSAFTRLAPGDVILTGTPSGVGRLEPGDRVAVAVEGIGELTNPVVAAT